MVPLLSEIEMRVCIHGPLSAPPLYTFAAHSHRLFPAAASPALGIRRQQDALWNSRSIRNGETNLGDLCADAYRSVMGADIGIVNGGGIRADIKAGNITYEDIINVHPYGNEMCVVEATGQEILDALELGASLYPEENGGFLQVSGLTYSIDRSQ